MTISLRLNKEDAELFKKYAKFHGITMSELVRSSVIERIEDEYDLKVYEEFEEEIKKGTLKTRPIEQLWKELDL